MDPTSVRALPFIIPILILAMILRRNLRARNLKMERLWVYPTILTALAVLALTSEAPPGIVSLLAFVVALAVGGAIGWYRGRLTHITIYPKTHEFTSRASVAGTILIGAVFALRYGLRMATQGGGMAPAPLGLHVDLAGITNGLMLFAVGMMAVQRVEMYLRCRKLIDEARGGGIAA